MTLRQPAQPADSESKSDSPAELSGRSKRRAAVELAVGYVLILVVIWTPKPIQRWLYWFPVAWILVSTVVSFPGWRAMGFRLQGLGRSLWVVGAATVLAAGASWLAVELHTLHAPDSLAMWVDTFLGYAIWSFVQQFLMQGFFLLRLLRLLPSGTSAAVTAAGIFALAHLPNPILTGLTLLWGLCACLVFVKHRNIYPLAVAHAIFGICVAVTIPATTIHNMRVGLGYLRYHRPAQTHLNQNDQTVSTVACVTTEAQTRLS